jgi:predicted lipase
MASICAGYITYLDYVLPTKIKLVTFGQPRTGDLEFASYVDQNVIFYCV